MHPCFSLPRTPFLVFCLGNLTPCSRCYRYSTHIPAGPHQSSSRQPDFQLLAPAEFCLRVFWSCLCLLCIRIHTWQARNARKLIPSGEALNQCWWEMIIPLYSCPLNMVVLRHGLHCFPESTRRIKLHLPTLVNLLDHLFVLTSFLSLSHFLTPLLVFPMIIT